MRVLVLLPGGATWRPVGYVSVLEVGTVDRDLHPDPQYVRQVELELHAVDEQLDELLEAVGERAVELGGVALDGRSLRPLVRPADAEPAGEPDDPGPIWEHLPGAWNPGPATGEVVDAIPAIEHIERGIADVGAPQPPASWVETRIGIGMFVDLLRGRRG